MKPASLVLLIVLLLAGCDGFVGEVQVTTDAPDSRTQKTADQQKKAPSKPDGSTTSKDQPQTPPQSNETPHVEHR